MKLEIILGKYYANGIEITPEQYQKYSQILQGKNIEINVIKDDENISEINQLKNQVDDLTKQIEILSSQLQKMVGEHNGD